MWTKPTDRGTTYWVVFGAGDDETIEVGRLLRRAHRVEHNACLAGANRLALLRPNALFRATPFRADAGPGGRGMTNRKILIVDDDSELREALVEQLALHEEFEPIAVDNGTKGVQTAKAGQIDLVIMDVGLPDVDGRAWQVWARVLPEARAAIERIGAFVQSKM